MIQPQLYGERVLSSNDPKRLVQLGYDETTKQIRKWEEEKGCILKYYCMQSKNTT